MADVIELRPGARRPVLTPAETLQGPFVTAMNAHYTRLLSATAKAHYREGFDAGERGALPFIVIAGLIGFLLGIAI